jgi:hypothetical protein
VNTYTRTYNNKKRLVSLIRPDGIEMRVKYEDDGITPIAIWNSYTQNWYYSRSLIDFLNERETFIDKSTY